MSNQKTICFSCLTPYHVFVAYILSKTLYKNCYKVILFSDHYHQQIYERALGLNLWDKIILIEERNKSWAQIHSQLKTIHLEDMDVLHYFSWGSIFQLLLIREIPEKTKVILTEEGVGTYYIQEAVAHWKTNYSPHSSPIDFDKVSEIWLFDKRLYVSELIKPLQDIAFYRYLSSPLALEFCKDLNTLFAYTPQQREWDILFFDQPLSLAHILSPSEERDLLQRIITATKGAKMLVKKHPTDNENKYKGLDLELLKSDNIPWEVVYLNEILTNNGHLENKTYITYNSTALLNTRILFKDLGSSNRFITLNKLLNTPAEKSQTKPLLDKYFEKFKTFYGDYYYELESIEELFSLIH